MHCAAFSKPEWRKYGRSRLREVCGPVRGAEPMSNDAQFSSKCDQIPDQPSIELWLEHPIFLHGGYSLQGASLAWPIGPVSNATRELLFSKAFPAQALQRKGSSPVSSCPPVASCDGKLPKEPRQSTGDRRIHRSDSRGLRGGRAFHRHDIWRRPKGC